MKLWYSQKNKNWLKVCPESIRYRGKKAGEKWLNVCLTKFFPDFLFLDQCFCPIFFHLTKNLFRFFLQLLLLLLLLVPIYLQNLLLPCFFYVLYLSWLIKAVLTKISKCEWKQGIEKNNNNNDINITRNCTFVNFKNYATLKASKRIGFKLVLIISRSKERVFIFSKSSFDFSTASVIHADSKPFKTHSNHCALASTRTFHRSVLRVMVWSLINLKKLTAQ